MFIALANAMMIVGFFLGCCLKVKLCMMQTCCSVLHHHLVLVFGDFVSLVHFQGHKTV